ncbi:MAG: sugar fermentation stimulation protein A [Reinekea sp.]|jgi:sugar fermentation stimulation protein A
MEFATPLIPARLIRRYKRFLADVRLPDGTEAVAHCPNPGSMMGMADQGIKIWLEPNDDPRKKLKYGWRLIEQDDKNFVGVDTGVPNRVVGPALLAHQIAGLPDYDSVRAEVKYADKSRVDFLLSGSVDTYVEVKSVTLSRTAGLAEFPDSVTARGAKHLEALTQMVAEGHRAVMFYMVQRTDCAALTLAADIDVHYALAFSRAMNAGVQVLAYDCTIDPKGVALHRPMPFVWDGSNI